jgi:hypothetical protein
MKSVFNFLGAMVAGFLLSLAVRPTHNIQTIETTAFLYGEFEEARLEGIRPPDEICSFKQEVDAARPGGFVELPASFDGRLKTFCTIVSDHSGLNTH